MSMIGAAARSSLKERRPSWIGRKVDPSLSLHLMGSSIIRRSALRAKASSSTSNANPLRVVASKSARATGAVKSLNPHWVSDMGPVIRVAMAWKAKLPSRRVADWDTMYPAPAHRREPTTTSHPERQEPHLLDRRWRSGPVGVAIPHVGRDGPLDTGPDRGSLAPGLATHELDGHVEPRTASTMSAVASTHPLSTTM